MKLNDMVRFWAQYKIRANSCNVCNKPKFHATCWVLCSRSHRQWNKPYTST